GERLKSGITEVAVHDWIRAEFQKAGLVTDSGPIVAVNGHAGNPHYEPRPETDTAIHPGDFVLIDMWATLDRPDGIYYDITWTGFCGSPPSHVVEVFETVRDGRDKAIERV